MSALTDRIAGLVLAGHSDAHIAYRLACHRATANAVRRDLRRTGRYVPARLTLENIPTGRSLADTGRRRQPTSEAQAADRRAALTAALTTEQGDDA